MLYIISPDKRPTKRQNDSCKQKNLIRENRWEDFNVPLTSTWNKQKCCISIMFSKLVVQVWLSIISSRRPLLSCRTGFMEPDWSISATSCMFTLQKWMEVHINLVKVFTILGKKCLQLKWGCFSVLRLFTNHFSYVPVIVSFRDVKPDNILLDEQGKDVKSLLCVCVCV